MKLNYYPFSYARTDDIVYVPELLDGETAIAIERGITHYSFTREGDDLIYNQGPRFTGRYVNWFLRKVSNPKDYYRVRIQ